MLLLTLEGSESFYLPLIDNNFIIANLISFSVLDKNHTLIVETENGQEIQNFKSDLKSFYIKIDDEIIGTFLSFGNNLILTYKFDNRQFEINKIDNEFILFDVNNVSIKTVFLAYWKWISRTIF